ncbi:hypothetical protein DdX_05107 [Ditylenchus destructor]|uniref:Uncharacterized protein n=1 Tax=Ditylenchus destructor TaxID=166010 RepID=A0AAD4N7J2_9BILA|nr:hypothetical protein DdX_05107 [Ditylenchus destructor]
MEPQRAPNNSLAQRNRDNISGVMQKPVPKPRKCAPNSPLISTSIPETTNSAAKPPANPDQSQTNRASVPKPLSIRTSARPSVTASAQATVQLRNRGTPPIPPTGPRRATPVVVATNRRPSESKTFSQIQLTTTAYPKKNVGVASRFSYCGHDSAKQQNAGNEKVKTNSFPSSKISPKANRRSLSQKAVPSSKKETIRKQSKDDSTSMKKPEKYEPHNVLRIEVNNTDSSGIGKEER